MSDSNWVSNLHCFIGFLNMGGHFLRLAVVCRKTLRENSFEVIRADSAEGQAALAEVQANFKNTDELKDFLRRAYLRVLRHRHGGKGKGGKQGKADLIDHVNPEESTYSDKYLKALDAFFEFFNYPWWLPSFHRKLGHICRGKECCKSGTHISLAYVISRRKSYIYIYM